MSWKLLHSTFPRLQAWELCENELIQAVKSLAGYPDPPPPFYLQLHSFICPSDVSKSRIRRFVRSLDFSSPTHLLWTSLQGLDHFRTPLQPHWRFTRSQHFSLFLSLPALLSKPTYPSFTLPMISQLAHNLILSPELPSPSESSAILQTYSALKLTREVDTLLSIAEAQVVNHWKLLGTEELEQIRRCTKEELLKQLVEEVLKGEIDGNQTN